MAFGYNGRKLVSYGAVAVLLKGRSMNDIQGYQNGPIETGASRAKEMSPRAYNLVMSALIFLGFCAMGAGAYFTSTMSFARMMMSGAALPLVFGSFILTIVGMVMMSAAASKQSVGLSLVGYVVFASTFWPDGVVWPCQLRPAYH